MHRVHFFPWGALALLAAFLLGVFTAMGYGLIALAILFVLVALGGGALMSFVETKQ